MLSIMTNYPPSIIVLAEPIIPEHISAVRVIYSAAGRIVVIISVSGRY
jgi:hypothetical protein